MFLSGVGNPHFCITRRSGRVMNFSASCSDRCLKLSRRRRYGVALEAVVFDCGETGLCNLEIRSIHFRLAFTLGQVEVSTASCVIVKAAQWPEDCCGPKTKLAAGDGGESLDRQQWSEHNRLIWFQV